MRQGKARPLENRGQGGGRRGVIPDIQKMRSICHGGISKPQREFGKFASQAQRKKGETLPYLQNDNIILPVI
jgi:hypothetical protein